MPTFKVHAYVEYRVEIPVEAATPREAAKQALKEIDENYGFAPDNGEVRRPVWCDGDIDFLVDRIENGERVESFDLKGADIAEETYKE